MTDEQSGPIVAVMVHVADVEAALAWYERAFPSATRALVPAPFELACLDIDGVRLEVVPTDEKVAAGAAGTVVYWRVSSLSAALDRMIALGATLYRGPMDIEDRLRMCQVRDPWGNCIGLRGPD
jgi:uncharacterized protein